jgi:PAS domain S-box-containing protein
MDKRPDTPPPEGKRGDRSPSDAASLELAEHSHEQLLDLIPDPALLVGKDGNILSTSRLVERLLGYERTELAGRPIECLVPDNAHDAHVGYRSTYTANFKTRTMGSGLSLVARHKDGHKIPVEVSLSPVKTATGSLVVVSLRDISERRATEEALREQDRLLTRAQQDAEPGYWQWRAADRIIVALSAEYRRIWGVSDDFEIRTIADTENFIRPDDRERVKKRDEEILAKLRDYSNEFRILRADGSIVHVLERASVHYDDTGEPIGYIGTI